MIRSARRPESAFEGSSGVRGALKEAGAFERPEQGIGRVFKSHVRTLVKAGCSQRDVTEFVRTDDLQVQFRIWLM